MLTIFFLSSKSFSDWKDNREREKTMRVDMVDWKRESDIKMIFRFPVSRFFFLMVRQSELNDFERAVAPAAEACWGQKQWSRLCSVDNLEYIR